MEGLKMYPVIYINGEELRTIHYDDHIGHKNTEITVYLMYDNEEIYYFKDKYKFTKKGINKNGKQVLSKSSLLSGAIWKLIFPDVKRGTKNILLKKQSQLLLGYTPQMSNSEAKEKIKELCKTQDDFNRFYNEVLGEDRYRDVCCRRKVYNYYHLKTVSILNFIFDIDHKSGCGKMIIDYLMKEVA